jgi:hypothetical protein
MSRSVENATDVAAGGISPDSFESRVRQTVKRGSVGWKARPSATVLSEAGQIV